MDEWINGRYSEKRHERLRSLCKQSAVDGILIIGGVDSLYSNASQALLKYLFLETCGRELLGRQLIHEPYQQLESVVLFITPDQTFIFYVIDSSSSGTILKVISQWEHVVEYVVRESMDIEEQEIRKVLAFRHMLHSADDRKRRIGVAFDYELIDDVHDIEKWPLIQSFAQENLDFIQQEKGFFTMNFDVINICSEIYKLFSQVDEHHAKHVYQNVEPLLYRQFDQFILKLDGMASGEAKSEAAISEDLLVFYEFGLLNDVDYVVPKDRGCRVLFGSRSSDLRLKSSPDVYLSTTGPIRVVPATHFVVQIEDPLSGVRFCRTYFASTGKSCQRRPECSKLSSDAGTFIENDNIIETQANTSVLIGYYCLLVQAYEAGCKSFLKSLQALSSISQCNLDAKNAASEVIFSTKSDIPVRCQEISQRQLEWKVSGLDANGQNIEVDEIRVDSEWMMLYLSLRLHDITSCQGSESLGSLIVGDTFLLQRKSSGTASLNVTQSFSYISSWAMSEHELISSMRLEDSLSSDSILSSCDVLLGEKVSMDHLLITQESSSETSQEPLPSSLESLSSLQWIPHATLLIDSDAKSVCHGQMCLFSKGFAFRCSQLCLFWISFPQNVEWFKLMKTSYEDLSVLILSLKRESSFRQIFPFKLNDSFQLGIPVMAHSRFQKFMMGALECWKKAARAYDIPFERVGGDCAHDSIFSAMEMPEQTSQEWSPSIRNGLEQWYVLQNGRRLIEHTQAAIITKLFPNFTKNDVEIQRSDINTKSAAEIPITVVLGVPGSDCTYVARQICEIGSYNTYWTHIEIDMRDFPLLEQHTTSLFLQNLIQRRLYDGLNLEQDDVKSSIQRRIMISMVGYLDVICLCGCLKRSIDELSLTFHLPLGAVITCVSLRNLYRPDPTAAICLLPYLTDQFSVGFTTDIVLLHTLDAQKDLAVSRSRVDMCNPFADVHIMPHDVFESSVASLVNKNEFEAKTPQQLRKIFYQNWSAKLSAKPSNPHFYLKTVSFHLKADMHLSSFISVIREKLTPFFQPDDKMYKMLSLGGIHPAKPGNDGEFDQNAYYYNRSCWCVEGNVSFSDDSTSPKRVLSTGTYFDLMKAQSEQSNLDEGLKIWITAPRSSVPTENALRELLASCYQAKEENKPAIRNSSSITLEEKRALQTQHALDPLPDDFMYDGQFYVDYSGNRLAYHPHMNQIIGEYFAEENEKARKQLSKVEQMSKERLGYVKCFVP